MDEWQIAERIEVDGRVLLLIEVKSGINKPYCTNGGVYITKSGADKRRISQEELQRLFQESQRFYADESLVAGSGITDLDENLLATYCEVTNIKHGISVIRNPIITSFATKLLPYRGIGSGIVRVLKHYETIDFDNDRERERFTVTVWRPSSVAVEVIS